MLVHLLVSKIIRSDEISKFYLPYASTFPYYSTCESIVSGDVRHHGDGGDL